MTNLSGTSDPQPLVTVVIPTRLKHLENLSAALRSVESQSFQNFTILIFVDGCNPIHKKKLRGLINDQGTRIVWSKKNRGLARSLNISFRLAKTPYLARMDDDDLCLPNRLAVQLKLMLTHKYDVLGSSAKRMDESGVISPGIAKGFDFNRVIPYRTLFFGVVFLHPTVLMTREWAMKNRYNPKWRRGQDRELWVRCVANMRAMNVPEPLLIYRVPSTPTKLLIENNLSTLKLLLRSRIRIGYQFYLLMPIAVLRVIYAVFLVGYARVRREC